MQMTHTHTAPYSVSMYISLPFGTSIFFVFLVVVLLVIFTPSCCSYCHCTTGSNSHTVVLSKPASYSPALFSIPIKRRKHAYQFFYGCIRYRESTAVVQLEYVNRCGKSTIKVRQKYVIIMAQMYTHAHRS